LRPDLKRGSLSPEEEQTILRLHGIIGNRWSTIASYLPGRTDNEIKNIWNTHLKKRLTQSERGINSVSTYSASFPVPTIPPVAINNCLSTSPPMQNSHCFPGSPSSECSFSYSKDSAPQFTADEIGLHGAQYDQQLWETSSAYRHETDEKRLADDYINSLKKFLDISEESSSQEHGGEDYDIAAILDPVTENNYALISDYINTEVFFSDSTFSGNQLDQTSLADHSQEYSSSSNSLHVYTPISLSPDFLLDFPENPIDVPEVLNPPLWMDEVQNLLAVKPSHVNSVLNTDLPNDIN